MVPINLNSLEQKFICSYDFIKIDNTFLKTTEKEKEGEQKRQLAFCSNDDRETRLLKEQFKEF